MLEALGEDAQRQGLNLRHRLTPALAIRHDTGQVTNLGQPAAVVFLFELDSELHRIRTHKTST